METSGLLIAIGASGSEGLQDIQELLGALPSEMPAVVMVVLHRRSDRVSHLRAVLARHSRLPVAIAEEAERLLAGTCYIGEPDHHLTLIEGGQAHLVLGSEHQFRNRSIDMLFNSLAVQAASRTIGVILSGSLDDGSRGLAAIHAGGGLTMVLEPGGKPRGMQQNAIDYDGPISFIGTADAMAATIARETARYIENLRQGRGDRLRPLA